jgi:hypothetical protein
MATLCADDTGLDLDYEFSHGFAARFIRSHVSGFVKRNPSLAREREDLEQELKLRLWERVSEFDPDVAEWGAFVRTVVDRELTSISRQKNLKRRGSGKKPLSINVLVPGEDGPIELAQLLGPWHQDAVTGRDRHSNVKEFERTHDVQEPQALAIAQRENEAAIGRLKTCVAANSWPTGYEEMRVFDAA